MNGSGWVYDIIASMTIDLYKDVTKVGSIYIEFPIKFLSFLNISNKSSNEYGIWSIIAHFHPVKTNACRTASAENFFVSIITGINLENGIIMVKDAPK